MAGIISTCFRDSDGNILQSSNETMSLLPASNMKVVSGYSAYKILGREFNFVTKFSNTGDRLYVSGDPCPLFSLSDMRNILRNKENGDITGITFDDQVLDNLPYGSGWEIEDSPYCYQTCIVPYSVNEGCIPSKKIRYSKLKDQVNHKDDSMSVNNQYRHFTMALSNIIGHKLDFKIGHLDTAEYNSTYEKKLTDILHHIEEFSCNFSIEVVTKYLSHHVSGGRGNWKESTKIIENLMKELNLDMEGIRIIDGSGLSRQNLLTTSFLSDLIFRIKQGKNKEFIDLLPSKGEGTLKNRLNKMDDLKIRAKTGSFQYCSSLTGYISSLDVSFSIILNNFNESDQQLRERIDDILMNFVSSRMR